MRQRKGEAKKKFYLSYVIHAERTIKRSGAKLEIAYFELAKSHKNIKGAQYWLTFCILVLKKATSSFTSNTLLIPKQDQFMF